MTRVPSNGRRTISANRRDASNATLILPLVIRSHSAATLGLIRFVDIGGFNMVAYVEKRKFGRRSALWHAWVAVNGRAREACIIRNISEAGALLEFPDLVPEALNFRLMVDEADFEAICDVRHKRGRFVGVFFTRAPVITEVDRGPTGTEIAFQLREAMSVEG